MHWGLAFGSTPAPIANSGESCGRPCKKMKNSSGMLGFSGKTGYFGARLQAARARIEPSPCPTATTSGWRLGGVGGSENHTAGRSQPVVVRTQLRDGLPFTASCAVPSTWHENMPRPRSSSEMPTMSRMTGQRCPSGQVRRGCLCGTNAAGNLCLQGWCRRRLS